MPLTRRVTPCFMRGNRTPTLPRSFGNRQGAVADSRNGAGNGSRLYEVNIQVWMRRCGRGQRTRSRVSGLAGGTALSVPTEPERPPPESEPDSEPPAGQSESEASTRGARARARWPRSTAHTETVTMAAGRADSESESPHANTRPASPAPARRRRARLSLSVVTA